MCRPLHRFQRPRFGRVTQTSITTAICCDQLEPTLKPCIPVVRSNRAPDGLASTMLVSWAWIVQKRASGWRGLFELQSRIKPLRRGIRESLEIRKRIQVQPKELDKMRSHE